MGGWWSEPRRAIIAGATLLAGGYAALALAPDGAGALLAAGRVAFYAGLVLLVVGVVQWLRQPPAPDPADAEEAVPGEEA